MSYDAAHYAVLVGCMDKRIPSCYGGAQLVTSLPCAASGQHLHRQCWSGAVAAISCCHTFATRGFHYSQLMSGRSAFVLPACCISETPCMHNTDMCGWGCAAWWTSCRATWGSLQGASLSPSPAESSRTRKRLRYVFVPHQPVTC